MSAEGNYSQANTNGDPLEKDFHQHLGSNEQADNALQRIRTAGSISISPELFEKIYLSPQNRVAGDLRKTFANPTPLCLIGFLLALFPLSFALLGWRGAGGLGAATVGTYWFAGGLLMILGAVGEFILGNTFPFIVFGSFGSFWLIFGATLTPYFNAIGAFNVPASGDSPEVSGIENPVFNHSFGYFTLSMGLMCFFYLICALRTNVVFVLIFLLLIPAFGLLTGVFLETPQGNPDMIHNMTVAAGALAFVVCLLGWYLFFGIMLASVDFPLALPVGDLSTMIKPLSSKQKVSEEV
ncbi:GPR1/FUN34/YaaH-class plasma membrane protein [Pseudovirgaria hyperparasitica]|uniref:GPR1/FUN34/YaaH-class plasma membrane protein n=1 Tax=Pseudovirgaria hyperparasitica TaxID=470096 RepID=A0A6A6WLI6_9PEZI|nr:GPR1/FUN34/YaaH-class plasma membrane protein [Pseudovirgaria hyperparasitica]KAF2763074.1 GPR1/FUN34/YaaH-class plasma membrane protein [Pseudovirgaria hyperparasitica]